MKEQKKKKKRTLWQQIPAMKFIMGGYALIVLVGSLLLWMPFASKTPGMTPFSDCVFTATSATCVTGLIRYDTFTHWTLFGQLVIITLIQIGGVGFMTIALLILKMAGRKIGLAQRSLMQDSISAPEIGNVVDMVNFIIKGTLLIEGIGAFMLMFSYIPRFGLVKGIYFSCFHSISAFCNGGFDLMGGTTGPCSSMTGDETNMFVNLVLMALVILGGLGFYVWKDLLDSHFTWSKLHLQSKLVLSVSIVLIFGGGFALFATEYGGSLYEGYSVKHALLSCMFQSVSARTAGFNSADLTKMSEAGLLIMIFLMLVGGSTGSTAGGMKTTTLWVLLATIRATITRKKAIEVFGRRLDEDVTRTASCIFTTYLLMITVSTIVISSIEKLPVMTTLFECTSAFATVGITLGITGDLCMTSKWIIAFLMLCGRVGSVSMLLAFSPERKWNSSKYPEEQIQMG